MALLRRFAVQFTRLRSASRREGEAKRVELCFVWVFQQREERDDTRGRDRSVG